MKMKRPSLVFLSILESEPLAKEKELIKTARKGIRLINKKRY